MGARGPLPDAKRNRRLAPKKTKKTPVVAMVPVPTLMAIPDAPGDLGPAGRATWEAIHALEWTQPSDFHGIVRLAQLEDERAVLRAALDDHGPVLTKPVMTSRGEVVGEEQYPNPALREMRRLDAQIGDLMKSFGLTPMARARLGLAVIAVEKESTLANLRSRRNRPGASA